MYASIDHMSSNRSRTTRAASEDDCDYTLVKIPAELRPERNSDASSKDECSDDYVLMG